MIALAAAVAAAHFAGAFWERDLGGLARELADHRDAPHAGLFGDVLRLCGCQPLPPLEAPDPLRQLVRAEAARAARLGARAASSQTLWRDVFRKDFFRRDPGNPPLANALFWPDEEEVWTGEIRFVHPPEWRCDKPARQAGAEGDAALVDALRAGGRAEAASRLGYHRSARLLAAGKKTEAAAQAASIDPAVLGELASWAALLRIQSGAEPLESAVALARGWSGPESIAARTVAGDHLARQGRWGEVAEITAELPAEGERSLLDHGRLLRARALLELGRRDEARASIPRDARSELARDLALEALSGRNLDAEGLELVRSLWPEPGGAFARLAERALFAGALDAARSAAAALQEGDARARLVAAELAFATGDRQGFAAAVARLGPKRMARGAERLARGRIALELAGALAALAPGAPALRVEAAAAVESLAERFGGSVARELATAAAALRTQRAGSAGVVPIPAPLPLPELPPVQVDWPEPRSLLAIPDGEGRLRDWFAAPSRLAGGPRP